MKLLSSIVVSGIALVAALLLCAAIKSPTLWTITWIACLVYGATVLGTALFICISRSYDREVERNRERIRRNMEL